MVRLRLQRFGAKREPYYRVVAADQRKARNGRFIEELGTYDPKTEPPEIRLDFERVEYWLDNGAQPTDTVRSFVDRMREEATNVVNLAEEGADKARREELRRQREREIEERRAELAASAEAEAAEEDDEAEAEAAEEGDDAEAAAEQADQADAEQAEADAEEAEGADEAEADEDGDDAEVDEAETAEDDEEKSDE